MRLSWRHPTRPGTSGFHARPSPAARQQGDCAREACTPRRWKEPRAGRKVCRLARRVPAPRGRGPVALGPSALHHTNASLAPSSLPWPPEPPGEAPRSLVVPLAGPLHLSPGVADADQLLQASPTFDLKTGTGSRGGEAEFKPGPQVLGPQTPSPRARRGRVRVTGVTKGRRAGPRAPRCCRARTAPRARPLGDVVSPLLE